MRSFYNRKNTVSQKKMTSEYICIGMFDVCTTRQHKHYMSKAHRARLKELINNITDKFIASILVPLITQKAPISLRILDFLCTNYAKQENIAYPLSMKKHNMHWFNIHLEYKKRLSSYKRRLFDPFQRRGRIFFTFHGKKMETTVAQLAFLIWASKNRVLQYAMDHHILIEQCMTKSIQKSKCRKLTDKKSKRAALTSAPKCDAFYYEQKVTWKCEDAEVRLESEKISAS